MSETSEWVIQSVKYIQIVDFHINTRSMPDFYHCLWKQNAIEKALSLCLKEIYWVFLTQIHSSTSPIFHLFLWNDYFLNLIRWKMSLILKYSVWWGKAATCKSSLKLNLKFILWMSAFLEQKTYINYCPDLGD